MTKVTVTMLAVVLIFSLTIAKSSSQVKSLQPNQNRQTETSATDASSLSIPQMINYQGKLTDMWNNPLSDTIDMTFRIFDVATGGNSIWSETQTNIIITDGLFNVLLGSTNPITNFPTGPDCYLEIVVGTQTITPRQRIVSNGYSYYAQEAVQADDAANLGGIPATSYVVRPIQSVDIQNGAVTMDKINQSGAVAEQVIKWDGTTWAPGTDNAGTGDNAWVRGTPDSVLFTIRQLGIARGGVDNFLFGDGRITHTNFGIQCTTGRAGLSDIYCTISGGWGNKTNNSFTTVSGGSAHNASGYCATVSGGWKNTASGSGAVVSSGYRNTASGGCATVSGGDANTASGDRSTVSGGGINTASGSYTAVGGGLLNRADSNCAIVSGGSYNTASGEYSTIGGGHNHNARGNYATVSGGAGHATNSKYATIGGGDRNKAESTASTVGGGAFNAALGVYTVVGGGHSNQTNGWYATIGGGNDNTVNGHCGTIGGGSGNSVNNTGATVTGGETNIASGQYAAIGGGVRNIASGYISTVSGGLENAASGTMATVGGGACDTAAGDYSFAAGRQVRISPTANHTFAFGQDFTTSTSNAVVFSHPGASTRVGINLTNPAYAIDLPNNADVSGQGRANAWTIYSSKRWKENIQTIDNPIEKVMDLRGVYFNWKESKKKDIGLIAEEVGKIIPEIVTYEENGVDAKSLDYTRLIALLIEAMKEQQEEISVLKKEVELLRTGAQTAKE